MRLALPLLLALALPAAAQERGAAERQAITDVSYVLGEAHALRIVCEGRDSQRWRGRMDRLLALEQADASFDKRLRDSFNAGFTYQEAAHPSCDADARAAYREAARRGEAAARAVVNASVAAAGMADGRVSR
jgi:uncharacterized protein (TIGR02301 family)